jgi:hypothetical protein
MIRRLQFSLRALLITVTGLAIWLGVEVNNARRQREIVSAVREAGGEVQYDWQLDAGHFDWMTGFKETGATHAPGPEWLRRIAGDEFFQTVVAVCIVENPAITEERLPAIDELPALSMLILYDTQIDDRSLKRISKLHKLTYLGISRTNVTDAGMNHLARLHRLKLLFLGSWPPREDGYTVSDEGLRRLEPLTDLEMLQVEGYRVTDHSVPLFEHFKKLRQLTLVDTAVTNEGVQRLRKSLPNCDVSSGVR